METQKNTFTRPYMADYLLAWSRNEDERCEDAKLYAGMTDSELAKMFYKEYEELQGVWPTPDVDPYDGFDY